MIRLSILLPCYRVEKYIQKCIDSIYQSLVPSEELEVLCFDDCSPDRTSQILDKLAKKYMNLRVIHSSKNVGAGGGRNFLLTEAKGQYIWFVDPDDIVASDVVLPMLELVEKHRLDVLMFNYHDMTEDGQISIPGVQFKDSEVLDGLSFVDRVFGSGIVWHLGYAVRFLVRREYLLKQGFLFPEHIPFQDTIWMPRVIMYADRIQATHLVGYIYWHHESSVCGQFRMKYPAKSIYVWSISVFEQLLDFGDELETRSKIDNRYHNYAMVFHDFAQSYYLNRLPILLCRSNREERKKFYMLLRGCEISERVKSSAKILTKMLLLPHVGESISNIASIIYKSTH